jgi:nucleoside-diphosphate-sugar epimerase
MNKILLIGGNGYIGSKLFPYLTNLNHDVDVVDTCWYGQTIENTIVKDYRDLSRDFLSKYKTIILLAGHSSVKMSEGDLTSCFHNNVTNFVELLEKINDSQKLIYASSSSVYGSVGGKTVTENYYGFKPYNQYDISKHCIDLYAEKSDVEFYGLRFGTLNGYAPVTRTDVMINAMTSSAIDDGEIKLYIKNIMRPILGINDLCRAIETIVNCEEDKRGLYNIASFNKTAEQIAYEVSDVLGVKVQEYETDPTQITNTKNQTKCYDFSISTRKFCREFKFKFQETVESITNELRNNYDNMIKTDRSKVKNYE